MARGVYMENSIKTQKTKYRCEDCGEEFYITIKPRFCPSCGGSDIYRGSKKARETAAKYIVELNGIIPQMNELASELKGLYVQYMTMRETVKTYAYRGIIDADEIPVFTMPKMIDAFYESRKERVKKEESTDE